MLAFRSLDTFPPLREPDRRRRDEERPFRSKQGTGNKPKNHLTEKLPYKSANHRFLSGGARLPQRAIRKPCGSRAVEGRPLLLLGSHRLRNPVYGGLAVSSFARVEHPDDRHPDECCRAVPEVTVPIAPGVAC